MAYSRGIFSKLGELATSDPSLSFCCGGQLPVQLPIRLHYQQIGKVAEVVLPANDSAVVQKLLGASREMTMTSEVETFDSALHDVCLGSDVLTTSFQLSATAILSEIESLMIQNHYIRAEFCKLDVYTTGNKSHYESHADNTCSREMLGTLIVCLPTEFEGGNLKVRNNGKMVEFKWSTEQCDVLDSIYWAAIVSDAEYEICAITSGYCLTLTYNIYSTKEKIPIQSTDVPLYQYLGKALSTPHFMRDGGILGFTCKYAYNPSYLNEADHLPFVLKGSDYMTFLVATSLGLNAVVRPVMEGKDHWYLLPEFKDKILVARTDNDEDISDHMLLLRTLDPRLERDACTCKLTNGITWCNSMPNWQSVLNLITTPVQVTAELLQQKIPDFNNVIMQAQSEQSLQLRSAGIPNTDVPVILKALKHLQVSSIHQIAGVHNGSNLPGSHLYACYQMAVLLVEVPQWGLSPRISATNEVPEKKRKIDSQFDTKKILYWEK